MQVGKDYPVGNVLLSGGHDEPFQRNINPIASTEGQPQILPVENVQLLEAMRSLQTPVEEFVRVKSNKVKPFFWQYLLLFQKYYHCFCLSFFLFFFSQITCYSFAI